MAIRKCFELNYNKNMTYQNCDVAETCPKGNLVSNANVGKQRLILECKHLSQGAGKTAE